MIIMVQAKEYLLSFIPSETAFLLDKAVNDESWSQLQEIRFCSSGGL